MGITALGLVAARTLWVNDSRRALAIMSAAFALGQIVGPVVAGYGFDLTGSFLLPSLTAAAALCISAALAFKLDRG
jgi:MFS family permease